MDLRGRMKERPASAPILGRAADQPGDLDELDEDATDPRQGGDRSKRGEGVVTRLDLDLGQRLEERRLADVRWPHEGDLGRALATDRDRVAVHGVGPDPRVVDLGEQPLPKVRVRAAPVIGQLLEE